MACSYDPKLFDMSSLQRIWNRPSEDSLVEWNVSCCKLGCKDVGKIKQSRFKPRWHEVYRKQRVASRPIGQERQGHVSLDEVGQIYDVVDDRCVKV